MPIVLNEYKYALEILNKHIISNKPSETLSILARYYRHKENKTSKEIYSLLDTYMENFYPNYNSVKWSIAIDKQIQKSKKYFLTEIDYVPITNLELHTINRLKNIRMKRLAFTILSCAKFSNLKNQENNNWVNCAHKELFKLAHINVRVTEQCKMLYELRELGLISISKKVDNINLQVEFIHNNSDVVIQITDMRELGYTYMKHLGSNIRECEKCGRLINPKGTKRKYCTECAKYNPINYKILNCEDCKNSFVVDSKNNTTTKCNECYKKYRQKYKKENEQKRRFKNKNV